MAGKKLLATVAGAAALVGAGVGAYAFDYVTVRHPKEYHKEEESEEDKAYWKHWEEEMAYIEKLPQKRVSLRSFDGLNLSALWVPAEGPSDKTVIAVHGYKSNGLREYATFLRFYHEMGFHVLLPDNRAHGRSEGKYIGFGWLDRLDLEKWIQYVLKEVGEKSRIVLQGVSMGGATVLMASGDADLPDQVKAIVADCAYTSVEEQLAHNLNQDHLPKEPILSLADLYTKTLAKYSYYEASTIDQVRKSKTPTIFITGDEDTFVPTEMTHRLFAACPAEKEIFVVPGAEHARAHVVDQSGYEEHVRNFISRYL